METGLLHQVVKIRGLHRGDGYVVLIIQASKLFSLFDEKRKTKEIEAEIIQCGLKQTTKRFNTTVTFL